MVMWPDMNNFYSYYSIPKIYSEQATEHFRDLGKRMIMSNVFPAMDQIVHTQANMVLTGPVINPSVADARVRLYRLNADIGDWLDEAL